MDPIIVHWNCKWALERAESKRLAKLRAAPRKGSDGTMLALLAMMSAPGMGWDVPMHRVPRRK